MALTIPSIFTAVDKVTAPLQKMTASVKRFGGASEAVMARQERVFNKLAPAISETGKQLLSVASSAAIAAGAIMTLGYTKDQIMAFEKGLASFRTIVSDLSDQDFAKFQSKILEVAKETKKSSVDVVSSFEKIAGLNAEFAKTADGLGKVSAAAITLAKASGDDLGPSAESLVGIMNQFSFTADQADRTINVLAAGQAVGAASISETAEALKVFGAVAKSSNTTIEQSVGLIETLASKAIKGSEAGTALRGSFVRLQKAGLGYKSGQFQINDALEEAKKKLATLHTAKAKDAFITKLFGLENITAGKILLDSVPMIKGFTSSVTGTSEAQKAASINSNTLGTRVEQLKNKWVNLVTGSDETGKSLNYVKDVLGFVTDHMETILSVGGKVLGFFLAWKATILLFNAAVWLVNAATEAWTVAQWALNAAMMANPIGLIIVGIAALIGLVVAMIKYWDEWGAALSMVLGPLGLIISFAMSLYKNWKLVTDAFKNDGILGGIKAIGKVLLDAILAPLQQILEIASHLPGKMGAWAQQGAANIEAFRNSMGMDTGRPDVVAPEAGFRGPVNPIRAQQTAMITGLKATHQLDVNIRTQQGTTANVGNKSPGVMPKTSSNLGQFGN